MACRACCNIARAELAESDRAIVIESARLPAVHVEGTRLHAKDAARHRLCCRYATIGESLHLWRLRR